MSASPIVLAHRTCPRDARENSLAGIAAAAGRRADGVELDVRRSRDGTPVLLHDRWLARVQHVPARVDWLRDARLTRLQVPTLVDALDAVHAHGLQVAIDTKDPGAADAVVAALRETGTVERALLWSQHMPTVRSYVRALPEAEVALLRDTFDAAAHDRLLADAAAIGARAVSAHQDVVTPEYIAAARERGLLVYCWYQDLAVQQARLPGVAAAGLAGVVTDWPTEARDALA